MRNLLALVGLAVVSFVGLGWYLGWYKVAVQPGSDGKQHISMEVDTKKIAADAKSAGERIGEFVNDKTQKSDPAKDDVKQIIDDFVGPPSPKKETEDKANVSSNFAPAERGVGRRERE